MRKGAENAAADTIHYLRELVSMGGHVEEEVDISANQIDCIGMMVLPKH